MASAMSEPRNGPILIRGADDFAVEFDVSREAIDRLAIYEQLLRQWQRTINLVAPSTLDAVWHRHFADSAQLLPLAPQARTWLDLGSGAGFPGLVMAILLAERPAQATAPHPNPLPMPEEARVTLIESNARKCAFLREVVRQTGITPRVAVDILSTRIEAAATQASLRGPDVVSARALAPLDRLLNLAAPLFASSTVGLFLKGHDAAAELEAAEKAWTFNVELVPSRTEAEARIVVIRNLKLKAQPKD
jgi:16S rRNA (guanine527-N7)-methyltransferase